MRRLFCLLLVLTAPAPLLAATSSLEADLKIENDKLKAELLDYQNANNALSLEMDHIRELSADPIKLNEENKRLIAQYEAEKRENNTLTAENQELRDQLKQNTFINGAIAVILGMLCTLMIQHFVKSKKRYSDWA